MALQRNRQNSLHWTNSAQPDSLSAQLRSTKLPLRRPPLAIGAQWKGVGLPVF